MIPEHLDDGFTTEVGPGVFVRPMLWAEKQVWRTLHVEDQWNMLATYVHGEGDRSQFKAEIVQVVIGYTSKEESQDFQDLSASIELQTTNPGLSVIDCSTCRSYCMDHINGCLYIGPSGHPTPLPKNQRVPCETSVGCPKGHWSEPTGLSNERWAKTWRHYWAYLNAGFQPVDKLMRRNRTLINWTVQYGRDRRFDPFIGGGTGGGTADAATEVIAGSSAD